MGNEKLNYVAVGSFVIAMVVALILWIGMVSGRTGPTHDYFIVYDNVMGLKTGVEILYEGFPVGLIESIEPLERDGRTRYRIDVSVNRDWVIPEDSRALITAPGLLASVVIDIRAGSSKTALEPGSEIPGEEATDVMAAVNHVANELVRLLEDSVKPVLAELTEAAPEIVGNVETISADLTETVTRINSVLEPVNVERVSQILQNLESSTDSFGALISDLRDSRGQVEALLSRVNELLEEDQGEVGLALADLQRVLGALARHMDAISSNLESTSRNLDEFSRQVRENPGVLLRGRDGADDS
jgi:phospholipid/cholesterol/gamma-HCH transport system substrate-binding protein